MPLFTAVSSSTRQLFSLLQCINFTSKALVQISAEGLKFSVEDSRVMQGLAFLDKELFTTYRYDSNSLTSTDNNEPQETIAAAPSFLLSLPAFLETLKIFGATESSNTHAHSVYGRDQSYTSAVANARNASAAFDARTLGLPSLCKLSYAGPGEPFCITIEEGNMTTTCELTTYEPEEVAGFNNNTNNTNSSGDEGDESQQDAITEDIPFDRNHLLLKIIMRSSLLHDAITELSGTGAGRLTFYAMPTSSRRVSNPEPDPDSTAAPAKGAASFSLSATGPLGSATISFARDSPAQPLETFQVPRATSDTFKFSMIKCAQRAMALASKVSIRVDSQGVLSLQFMIDVEGLGGGYASVPGGGAVGLGTAAAGGGGALGEGKVSFVDFRFVPFVEEEGDGEESSGSADE